MNIPLHEGLELLEELATTRARPDVALAKLAALRARHSAAGLDLYWDEEHLTGTFAYDLVLDCQGRGTVALSLAPADLSELQPSAVESATTSKIVALYAA